MNEDAPTREAMSVVYRAFRQPDVRHENLTGVAEIIQADPELSASMQVYIAGIACAKERLAARGIQVPMWTSLAEILYGP